MNKGNVGQDAENYFDEAPVSSLDEVKRIAMQGWSIIIPTFNRAELLHLIFCALADQTAGGAEIEVLVCDSNS